LLPTLGRWAQMPGVFTLKKKPGALATSVALHKANPRLKEIYHQYYTTKGRDFIDLIFFVSEHGLELKMLLIYLQKFHR